MLLCLAFARRSLFEPRAFGSAGARVVLARSCGEPGDGGREQEGDEQEVQPVPERVAAESWPGPVERVAGDDEQAERATGSRERDSHLPEPAPRGLEADRQEGQGE